MTNKNIKNYGFGSKYRTKEFDDAARAKTRGVLKPRKWSREKCILQLEELMDLLKKKIDNNNFKELTIIIDKMMDIIRYLYPPVQHSVNLNIETTVGAVIERLRRAKKQEIIIENKSKKITNKDD